MTRGTGGARSSAPPVPDRVKTSMAAFAIAQFLGALLPRRQMTRRVRAGRDFRVSGSRMFHAVGGVNDRGRDALLELTDLKACLHMTPSLGVRAKHERRTHREPRRICAFQSNRGSPCEPSSQATCCAPEAH